MRRPRGRAARSPRSSPPAPHGALPHAEPRDVEIPAGALVVIDWGAQRDGYCSDCTRTFATGELDGRRPRGLRRWCSRAQQAALDAVAPGPAGKEVDAVAREVIDAAGHGEQFGHGLGHGVGLEVHEGPRLAKRGEHATARPATSSRSSRASTCPGAFGVRIEDLVVVTDDGADVLSSLPKELTTVA